MNVKVKMYETVILPVVLYGCETWSFILKEEHRLRVFENRVVRRIFGPNGDSVSGEWRNLHNEELHILYSSQISLARSVKENKVGGTRGTHGRGEMSVQGLSGKVRSKGTTRKSERYMGGWDEN
jgi:hypothetical protein